jgi:26S proteasome regulatory subunit N7
MDEGLPKNPKLELAQFKFYLSKEGAPSLSTPVRVQENNKIKEQMLKEITECNMTPFYLDCCKELGWTVDNNLVSKMKNENETRLKVVRKTLL